ncbi:MAG: hypothetical protein HRU76_01650 [Phycisphaeraceae bacterium]|nr:hypothetical protein [Phycisphaerales bacterium]QOJ16372.1 MAG: hypothetical protein HRU76_01650 [Phycisphaeraceae bacterium]
MSVSVGRTKLKNALQDLLVKWEETRGVWNDVRSQQFARQYLEPLDPAVRAAVAAMDRLASQIAQAERDCG